MAFHPLALLIALPPVIGVFFLARALTERKRSKRSPFNSQIQRPPGESCREKMESLSDELVERFLWLMGPLAFGALLLGTPAMAWPVYLVLTVLSAAITLVACRRLWKTVINLRNYRLGFDGERAVAQDLNQALTVGWKVFHDVQFEGFNIDHVLLAPTGVFAIETKARSKGLTRDSHRVTCDGNALFFPGGVRDDAPLRQALRNATTLGLWLREVVGAEVWVHPIVTLPGWWVERLGQSEVMVTNPKEILPLVSKFSDPVVDANLMAQIGAQLEKRNLLP